MPRWTIRGVDPDAVYVIQAIRTETGASLGAILSEAIRYGQAAAREKFTPEAGGERPIRPEVHQIHPFLETLWRIITASARAVVVG